MSNLWRSLYLPLIKCVIELDLTWSEAFIMSKISRTAAVPDNPPNPAREETETTSATFQINNAKFYVPVVTLSVNGNIKYLENIKHGFRRAILVTDIGLK